MTYCECSHPKRAHASERVDVWITSTGHQSYTLKWRGCLVCPCPRFTEVQPLPRVIATEYEGLHDGIATFRTFGYFGNRRYRRELNQAELTTGRTSFVPPYRA